MPLTRNRKLLDQKYMEYFIPTVINAMSTSLSFIVDGMIVSILLGAKAMAAVNAALPVSQMMSMFAALLGIGASGCISVAFGRRDFERAHRAFTAALMLVIGVGVAMLVLQTAFFDQCCGLLLKEPEISPLIAEYYRNLVWGTPLMILAPAIAHMMRADGQAKLASAVILVCNILNLLFDIFFIRVLGMGIGGASLATVSANMVGIAMIGIGYFFTKKRTLRLHAPGAAGMVAVVLRTGMPAALGSGLMAVKINFITRLAASLEGLQGVVAFSICMACLTLMSMFISGASQAMMPILGIYYGERDRSGVTMVVRKAVTVLLSCAAVCVLVLEISPDIIMGIYRVQGEAMRALVRPAVRLFSLSLPFTAISYLLLYFYMTVEKRWLSTLISILEGLALILPCAWGLSRLMGLTGIWLAFIAAELITLAIVFSLERGRLFACPNWENKALLSLSANEAEIQKSSAAVQAELLSQGMNGKMALLIAVAVEEIMENSREYNGEKAIQYDVLLHALEDGWMLSVTDNGKAFDPTIYTRQEEASDLYAIDHIRMMRSISSHVDYHRVIGLNKTCAMIPKAA